MTEVGVAGGGEQALRILVDSRGDLSGSVVAHSSQRADFHHRDILCGICYLNLSLLAVAVRPPSASELEPVVGYRRARCLSGTDRDHGRVWKCSCAIEVLCTRDLLAIRGVILRTRTLRMHLHLSSLLSP
jgi:hypothetical protein